MDAMLLRRIVETLPRFAYRFGNEIELHAGIEQVLKAEQVAFTREHVAGPQDRFDFLLETGIVIEAKVQGSLTKALPQVQRYAAREDVSAVVLVTTRFWGRNALKLDKLHGKPFRLVHLRGAAF
jgi:hypothetical protein